MFYDPPPSKIVCPFLSLFIQVCVEYEGGSQMYTSLTIMELKGLSSKSIQACMKKGQVHSWCQEKNECLVLWWSIWTLLHGKCARTVFIHELGSVIKRTSAEALRASEFYDTKQQVNKSIQSTFHGVSVYQKHTETLAFSCTTVKSCRSQLIIGRAIFFTCEKRRSRTHVFPRCQWNEVRVINVATSKQYSVTKPRLHRNTRAHLRT